uniref:(northern house mosquito) hypothetical protein n=1 Tax=Culex pipiens TaxID=7175 RepID=A0A8D8KRH1_CULPI
MAITFSAKVENSFEAAFSDAIARCSSPPPTAPLAPLPLSGGMTTVLGLQMALLRWGLALPSMSGSTATRSLSSRPPVPAGNFALPVRPRLAAFVVCCCTVVVVVVGDETRFTAMRLLFHT